MIEWANYADYALAQRLALRDLEEIRFVARAALPSADRPKKKSAR